MAKRDYTEDPPAHFCPIFVKACINCSYLKWTGKYWYVCDLHKFKFNTNKARITRSVCGSWEANLDVLDNR